jgi:aminomethyltransferase
MGFEIAIGARVRKSPFFAKTVENGVKGFSIYNHMFMPTSYGDPVGEYWRLVSGVSMWDVAVERQVQLEGPDAETLARFLTPRNLKNLKTGQGRYVPMCDHDGRLINDPVLLPLRDDLFWLSIADSDMVIWARAIAAERKLDVKVHEPDVSPLAVQGPKAVNVVSELFGDWVGELTYFGFRETELEGIPLVVARSGWSKQGGFELYLRDGSMGERLWEIVKEAGRLYDIGPGCPNYIERLESGLVSYGADTDDDTNPYEMGLGKFVDCEQPIDFVGKDALRKIRDAGPKRRFTGYFIDGKLKENAQQKWPVKKDGDVVGFVSATCHSPRLDAYIGVGLIANTHHDGDTGLQVETSGGPLPVRTTTLPFEIPQA